MSSVVLPDKYYLSHFFDLLDNLDRSYRPVVERRHLEFIDDFRSLSEDAQCLYVRMANRKGHIFSIPSFEKYKEINSSNLALQELEQNRFVSRRIEKDAVGVLNFLSKVQVFKWLLKCGFPVKASQGKEALIALAQQNQKSLNFDLIPDSSELILQERTEELEYLLFLYFGKIQTSLSLYTLRDLGIRKANPTKIHFKPRYTMKEHAQADFFFFKAMETMENFQTTEEVRKFILSCNQFEILSPISVQNKNKIFLQIASQVEDEDVDLALMLLDACSEHPAREKKCRILFKIQRKEDCRILLEKICQDPKNDQELFFAEDFLSRKFEKKKVGYLSQALKDSTEICVSDSYLKNPERGVRDLYRSKGFKAHFTENYLWLGLFGLLFWDELFEKEDSALYNPFDRSPTDLVGPDFYQKNRNSIEEKLNNLKNSKKIEHHLMKVLSLHHGKPNDIFRWHPNLIPITFEFLRSSGSQDVSKIMRNMAMNFASNCRGFPDLMVIKDQVVSFIEVKAEGDLLRAEQLSKIRLLIEAGFNVEILKVKWQTDPNQTYVVVDVETTGGSSDFHRVTEIGAVKVKDGKIVEEFQTLINPGRPIPPNITQITGISNQMVATAPRFEEMAGKFNEFTKGAIFVAHNVRFDYGFIQREFQRLNLGYVRPRLCTVQEMRKNFPGLISYSLKNLTRHFNISLEQHHRALCDAKAATQLLFLVNGKRAPREVVIQADEYSSAFPPDFDALGN